MLRSIAATAVVVLVVSSSASPVGAQTIYAPVQYQYGEGRHRYFYGGSDPSVFAMAERRRALDEMSDYPYPSQRYNHAYLHHRLIGRLDRVYSDVVPYTNARVYGYLPVDAANDAYANVPRYFRKADLLRAAVPLPDGSHVVPAQALPVTDDEYDRRGLNGVAVKPVVKPRAILIIPKKPARTSDKLVASAAK